MGGWNRNDTIKDVPFKAAAMPCRSSTQNCANSLLFSPIRTLTVGPGVSPDLLTLRMLQALAGLFDSIKITAGGEFHPALRIQEHYSSIRNHVNGEMCFRADFS